MKILFSTSKRNLISAVIRYCTWGEWSHVEVHVDKDHLLGADLLNGVNILTVENRMGRSDKFLLCEFDIADEQKDAFVEALTAELGKKYDIGGIFGHVFRRNWQATDKWFCSELIAAASQRCSYPILNISEKKSGRVTPRDLLLSTRMVRVTEDPEEIVRLLSGDA